MVANIYSYKWIISLIKGNGYSYFRVKVSNNITPHLLQSNNAIELNSGIKKNVVYKKVL